MKIINSIWFTQMGREYLLIGIVVGRDEITKQKKLYIGVSCGLDQKADEKYIAETGAKLTKGMLAELTKWLED